MKLYKVIKNNKSFNGGTFDWTKHLPKKNGAPGKWTSRIKKLTECAIGYHVTPHWNMWYEEGCDVFECETKGLVKKENPVGVVDKFVCESVRLVRKLNLELNGDHNTGNQNTGDYNTGNYNTGDRNTGNCNTGNHNAGYLNTGDLNTGNHNTGNQNTGDYNTGNYNTGDRNTGNCNAGDYNTGDYNTGNYNTGNRNTGAFNTSKPKYYELFNKPIISSVYENIVWPEWFFFKLEKDYKNSWLKSFKYASAVEVQDALKIPNFDYQIFEEITGISKKMIDAKLKKGGEND